jgi:hypothetical protein
MIVHDRFPFLSHRTLEEVAETEELRRQRRNLNWSRISRLHALEARSAEIPPEPEPPAAA